MALSVIQISDDGLTCPEVGAWAEEKYRIVSLYQQLFATGMKDKWDKRVYLDLYSGAGHNRIRGTNRILQGAALTALCARNPFDKYIFYEADPERLAALRTRAEKIAPGFDIEFVPGDCDSNVNRICASIPPYSSRQKVLSLCFLDPFDFGINFETVKRLSEYFMDFLVLLAVGMDANRNYDHYVDGESKKIDVALGNSEWRDRWQSYVHRSDFRTFLASEFSRSMEALGYQPQPTYQMRLVRSGEKNLPLYYIALFSRSKVAYTFWEEVLKYSTDQQSFEF